VYRLLGTCLERIAVPERQTPAAQDSIVPIATVVVLGAIMTILDTTIVNVALNTLSVDLRASLSTIQWAATGYLLALAIVIPTSGWASERFGTRRIWTCAVVVFLCGSALCGLAWSADSLIAFRVLQGLGGGAIMPVGQIILVRKAGPERLARVMSIVGVPMFLGPILGPVLGGVIIVTLNWHWIFYVNVPVGLFALALAYRVLEHDAAHKPAKLDVRGLALLSPGLGLIVYGLSEADSAGGIANLHTLVGLIAGTCLTVAFVVHASGRGRSALIDVSLFAKRSFAAGAALMVCFGMSVIGAMILLPLYYQVVRGNGVLDAGVMTAFQGVGIVLSMPIAGRLTRRFGAACIVPVGVAIAVVGTLAFTQVGTGTPYALLAVALVVRGFGLGAMMMPSMTAAYIDLEYEQVPRASSALNALQRIGASFGAAFVAVLLQHELSHISIAGGHSGSTLTVLQTLPHAVRAGLGGQLAGGFSKTFWAASGLTAVGLIPALLLPHRRRSQDSLGRSMHGSVSSGPARARDADPGLADV
jgi:EmrB/QacA subfamily drug resistance transporter